MKMKGSMCMKGSSFDITQPHEGVLDEASGGDSDTAAQRLAAVEGIEAMLAEN